MGSAQPARSVNAVRIFVASPPRLSSGGWWSPPLPHGDVLLQAFRAVVVDEPLVAHSCLLHDPPRADVLWQGDGHDAVKADRAEAVGQHGDRRLGGVSLVPGGTGVVVSEVDFWPCSLVD